MKTFNYSNVVAVAVLVASALSSCVNEEYDVKDINTEVTVLQEGLSLPLGSTKQLALKDLLSGLDEDMLQVLDGGAYAFRISDSLSLGDQLPDLKEIIDIPDVEFANKTSFSLGGLDVESLSIEGQAFDYSFALANESMIPEIEVPVIEERHENMTKVWEYGKAARDMKIDLGESKTITTKSLFKLPDINVTQKVEIPDLPEAVIEEEKVNFVIKQELASGFHHIPITYIRIRKGFLYIFLPRAGKAY